MFPLNAGWPPIARGGVSRARARALAFSEQPPSRAGSTAPLTERSPAAANPARARSRTRGENERAFPPARSGVTTRAEAGARSGARARFFKYDARRGRSLGTGGRATRSKCTFRGPACIVDLGYDEAHLLRVGRADGDRSSPLPSLDAPLALSRPASHPPLDDLVRHLLEIERAPLPHLRRPQQRRPEPRPRRPGRRSRRNPPRARIRIASSAPTPSASSAASKILLSGLSASTSALTTTASSASSSNPHARNNPGSRSSQLLTTAVFTPARARLQRAKRPGRDVPRRRPLVMLVEIVQRGLEPRVVQSQPPHRVRHERAPEPAPVADVPHARGFDAGIGAANPSRIARTMASPSPAGSPRARAMRAYVSTTGSFGVSKHPPTSTVRTRYPPGGGAGNVRGRTEGSATSKGHRPSGAIARRAFAANARCARPRRVRRATRTGSGRRRRWVLRGGTGGVVVAPSDGVGDDAADGADQRLARARVPLFRPRPRQRRVRRVRRRAPSKNETPRAHLEPHRRVRRLQNRADPPVARHAVHAQERRRRGGGGGRRVAEADALFFRAARPSSSSSSGFSSPLTPTPRPPHTTLPMLPTPRSKNGCPMMPATGLPSTATPMRHVTAVRSPLARTRWCRRAGRRTPPRATRRWDARGAGATPSPSGRARASRGRCAG